MYSSTLREVAMRLRKSGYSYSYISQKTGLAKSTLSDWLGELPYTPNQETVERVGKAIAAANMQKTRLRQEETEKIRKTARKDIGTMRSRDLFMFGLGLYLGEGAKTHDITRVSNSDITVIRLAIAWFQELGVVKEQFRLTLHLYPDSNADQCIRFWSRGTAIPKSQFGKIQIDLRTNKMKSKRGKLPYGTAHLTVRSLGKKEFGVILSRKIMAWTDTVSHLINTAGVV